MGQAVYDSPTSYLVGLTYFGLKVIAIALLFRAARASVYFLSGAFTIGLMLASTVYWRLGPLDALGRYVGLGWLLELTILLSATIYLTALIWRGKW